MKISCLHGYFRFDETRSGQVSEFMSLFGLDLVSKDDYFTFSGLEAAPEYSIVGSPYLGVPAIKTFAGKPWEVMRENELVYSIDLGAVVPIASIVVPAEVKAAGNYFISSGLLQPGSLVGVGSRVKDFSGFYLTDAAKFRYTEVGYD